MVTLIRRGGLTGLSPIRGVRLIASTTGIPLTTSPKIVYMLFHWVTGPTVMKNWHAPESGWPEFATASLPEVLNVRPIRNSSGMVNPQLWELVPVGSPD